MKTQNYLSILAVTILTNVLAFASDLQTTIIKSDVTCFGQANGKAEVIISGGVAPYVINWSNGSTGIALNDLRKGKYLVTVTDAAGQTVKDSVMIAAPAPLSVSYNSKRNAAVANFNGEMNVMINGGTPWDLETTAPMYMVRLNDKSYYENPEKLQDGVYKLSVEDANGCKLAFNINLKVQLDNETPEEFTAQENGLGLVKMIVHPIHIAIKNNQATFSQSYN